MIKEKNGKKIKRKTHQFPFLLVLLQVIKEWGEARTKSNRLMIFK